MRITVLELIIKKEAWPEHAKAFPASAPRVLPNGDVKVSGVVVYGLLIGEVQQALEKYLEQS